MSLNPFKRKTAVAVSVATATLNTEIADNRFTNIILQAIRRESPSFSSDVLYASLTGYNGLLDSYYNFGQDNYVYGLPITNLSNVEINAIEVKAVLDVIEGESVTVIDSFLYKPTPLVWALWWLYVNDGTYIFTANTLTQSSVTMDVVGATVNSALTEITVKLETGGAPVDYLTTITDMPVWDDLYYFIEYRKDASDSIHHIWAYQESLGTHPTLDVDTTHIFDNVYPIIPLRLDDVNVNEDEDSEEYQSSRALLQTVHINIDEMISGVTQQYNVDGELIDNPDLNLISDIFYLYGLNIYGSTQIEKKALFTLFEDLFVQARSTKATYDAQLLTDKGLSNNTFLINSNNFDFELEFSYITSTNVIGYPLEKGQYSITHHELNDTVHLREEAVWDKPIINSYITLRYQFEANQYTELIVKGLFLNHEIKSVKGIKSKQIHISSFKVGDELTDEQKNFIIPLAVSTVNQLTQREADDLISICSHIQIYASDSQKLEWYQSPFFIGILKIVMVVFVVLSFMGDYSGSTAQIIFQIGSTLAVRFAFQWVLQKLLILFEDNAFLTAVVLVVGVYVSFKIALPNLTDMPLANTLVAAVNSTITVANIRTEVQADLLAEDQAAFYAKLDEAQKLLATANELLEVNTTIDPSALIDTRSTQYESANDFYNRTLETAPGQLVFDHLHNYVDINLNLEYISI